LLGSIGARLAAWKRRHPRAAAGGLAGLAVVLLGVAYQAGWYFWGRSHLQAAQAAVGRHDWSAAHEHLEASLRVWPESPDVHLLAARVARRLEHFASAQDHLDTCQRLRGGESSATAVERALLRLHRGDLAGTEDFLRARVRQEDAAAVEILDVLSAALILNYRVAEAQKCLDYLLARQPDHFPALVRRGWTARNMARHEEAVQFYEKALALRPEVDAVRLALAEIQVVLGNFTDAQGHFEQLRARQPENPSVRFGLARCLAGRGHKAEALELLDELLADYPNDWKVLGERGWLAVQLDRPAEGEGALRRAVALAPPDLPLLIRFTDCLRAVGKHDEARAVEERTARLRADFQRAGQLGDLIREKRPDDPDLRHELACILLRLGKEQDALHWFATALARDPAHRPTHEALAAYYARNGAFEQAAYHRRFVQSAESPDRQGGVSPTPP
jgi:tetratricopeptide (TPR) repeat protein